MCWKIYRLWRRYNKKKTWILFFSKNFENLFTILNKIGKILEFHLKKEVVVIGRIAGQYAKPRSSPYEFVNNGIFIRKNFFYKKDKNKISKSWKL